MTIAAILGVLALNPAVSSASVAETICRPGWTATVRPSTGHIVRIERAMLPAGADRRAYVVDHVMPISLGGHPSDPANLRPQLVATAKLKDLDERRLGRAVCAGRISLDAAQAEMARLWP